MPRHVLVTGAYGFIGRHAARRWSREGWRVTGIGHGSWSRDDWRSWGLDDWHAADVTLETLVTYAAEPNVIVHCAGGGSVGFSVAHPYQDFQRTTQTTIAVLEYARLHSAGARVVLPSSAAVYGAARELPIGEGAHLAPVSPYGVHKRLAEELCMSYAARFDLRVAIVRFFSVYGEGLRKQLMWDACRKLAASEVEFGGTGEERRDWVYVSDAADLLALAADHASAQCGVVNGGSGVSTCVRDIVSQLARYFPQAGVPRFTGTARPGDPDHYQANPSRALALGWRPRIQLEEGIARYAAWYKAGAV
jgi:UDP-glucose 4-epimerase